MTKAGPKRGSKPVSIARKRGFAKFQAAMLKAVQEQVVPKSHEMKAFGIAMQNHLLDLDGPTQTRIGPRTQKQIYFSKVFYGFTEIFDCLEMLKDIAYMVSKSPYPKASITPDRYLQFLVEAYFGEIYIFQERLEQYLTVIERLYKDDSRHSPIRAACKLMVKLTAGALDRVLRVRHNHVHHARLSDKGIDRLKTIGLLANNSRGDLGRIMKAYYRSEYVTVKRSWQQYIKQNNKAIRQLVDIIAEHLFKIIFEETTLEFKYPSGII